MTTRDLIVVTRFLQGKMSLASLKCREKADKTSKFYCDTTKLVSSGKMIAKRGTDGDEIILPNYSDTSLSKVDLRRRALVWSVALEHGLKVTAVG